MKEEKVLTKEEIVEDFKENLVSNDEIEGNDDYSSYSEESTRILVTDKQDPTVSSLLQKYTRQKLILQPNYQRKFVMKQAVASRLIESMLLGIPLPVVYFAEEDDGSLSVIDGQQRLTAIISFIKGKFLYNDTTTTEIYTHCRNDDLTIKLKIMENEKYTL